MSARREASITFSDLQILLDEMWELVDDGEPQDKIVNWLRGGNHYYDDVVADIIGKHISWGYRLVSKDIG